MILLFSNIYKAFSEFIRFSIIGVCNTAIHAIIFLLITSFSGTQLIANIMAFIVAATFSCVMNTFWSFQRKISITIIYRFVIVSFVGLFISSTIAGLADYLHIRRYITLFCVLCILPVINFILHKLWTYNENIIINNPKKRAVSFNCFLRRKYDT